MTPDEVEKRAEQMADEMWNDPFRVENAEDTDAAIALGKAVEKLFKRAQANGSTGTLLVGRVLQRRVGTFASETKGHS